MAVIHKIPNMSLKNTENTTYTLILLKYQNYPSSPPIYVEKDDKKWFI